MHVDSDEIIAPHTPSIIKSIVVYICPKRAMVTLNYTSSIIITGGTHGMGYQATLAVARQCPQSLIVIASRTDPHDAATTINRMLRQDNVIYMALDLGSLANVRKFVKTWKEEVHLPIRALVLNAAIQFPRDIKYSTDGMEMSFAVNHVGHALLTHLLLGEMDRKARIVVVASSVSGYSSQSSHATLPPP